MFSNSPDQVTGSATGESLGSQPLERLRRLADQRELVDRDALDRGFRVDNNRRVIEAANEEPAEQPRVRADLSRNDLASRDLAGSRDIAAVLDARIRPRIDPLVPQPHGPWTRRVPNLPDPSRRTYLMQIAAMMDDRAQRLGQHTAQTVPAWAIQALGPVPADPAARQDWARKAASIAAYREMYGYDHPGDPIGPEPSHRAPDQRAAWHQAFAAFSPAAGPDARAIPDGRLWLLRDSYAAQTAWAPPPRRQRVASVPARRLRRRPRRCPRRRRS